jgi:hypothetical protein
MVGQGRQNVFVQLVLSHEVLGERDWIVASADVDHATAPVANVHGHYTQQHIAAIRIGHGEAARQPRSVAARTRALAVAIATSRRDAAAVIALASK